jgi:flagellin
MVIQHNLLAMNANRRYNISVDKKSKSSEKLSSGYKINRSADDAAGLQVSEKLRSQIRGLDQASDNASDGISLIQIADGALGELESVVHRVRELAVKSANDTNQNMDRDAIQKEVDHLIDQFDTISYNTEFNKINLLTGDFAAADDNATTVSDAEVITGLLAGTYKSDYATKSYTIGGTTYSANQINSAFASLSNRAIASQIDTYSASYGSFDAQIVNLAKKSVDNVLELASQSPASNSTFESYLTSAASKLSSNDKFGAQADLAVAVASIADATLKQATQSALAASQTTTASAATIATPVGNMLTGTTTTANTLVGSLATTPLTAGSTLADIAKSYKEIVAAMAAVDAAAKPTPGIHLQIGANKGQSMVVNIAKATAAGMRLKGAKIGSYAEANQTITVCDFAIDRLSRNRSSLGAYQNRLEFAVSNDDNQSENLQASESRIRDVDMADEMVKYSKNNILVQAGQSMMAQANSTTQGIVTLLQQ